MLQKVKIMEELDTKLDFLKEKTEEVLKQQ